MSSRDDGARRIYDDIFERVVGERYRIKQRLGAGAFGQVFKADYEVFGIPLRTVALKLFTKGFVTEKNAKVVFKEALMLEALVAGARTRGEAVHLVTVYDIGVLKDYQYVPYIAMEFVDGGSLEDELRRAKRFPLAQTIRYARDICAGLRIAHEASERIVHRDLKPANVLLTQNGFLKVSDFGVAVERAHAFSEGGGGTITYAPPEMRNNVAAAPNYDIYALGVTMLELLLGHNPISSAASRVKEQGRDMDDAIAHAQQKLEKLEDPLTGRPLTELCAELSTSSSFRQVLTSCLSTVAEKRYRDARSLDEALAACQRGDVVAAPLVTAQEEMKTLLTRAQRALRRGELAEAQGAFQDVCRQEPRNVEALSGLAATFEQQGQLQQACDTQRRAAESVNSRESWSKLAELYQKADKESEAKAALMIARLRT
jgi:serine/threonine protein kinase